MTRRVQAVVYDLDPDRLQADTYGGDVYDVDDIRRVELTKAGELLSVRITRRNAFRLRLQTTGYYSIVAAPTVRQQVRGGTLVRVWVAVELFFDQPTGTTVEARLHDGTDAYYWTGAAWAVAGALDWNTPTVVETNFSSFAVSVSKSLTVQWRLQTSDRTVTPSVFGAAILARLVFQSRSGTTAAGTLSDSWLDDIVHRELIPFLQGAAPEVTDETTNSTGAPQSVISYAPIGDSLYTVADVAAVYDLDNDAEMDTPLAGSFDSGTSTFTLTTPLPDGTAFASRVLYTPIVAYTADRMYFEAELPHIVIETLTTIETVGGTGVCTIRLPARTTACELPVATEKKYDVTILLQADGPVHTFDLAEAIERLLGGERGIVRVSTNTGMIIGIHGNMQLRPARSNEAIGGAARFDLTLRTEQYLGAETVRNLLTSTDNFSVLVGTDQSAAIPEGQGV